MSTFTHIFIAGFLVCLAVPALADPQQSLLHRCSALAGSYADRGEVSGNVPELRRHLSRVLAQLLKQSPFPLLRKGLDQISETRIRFLPQNGFAISAHFSDGAVVEIESADVGGFTCKNGVLQSTVELSGHSEGQSWKSTEHFSFARASTGGLRMDYSREVISSYTFVPSTRSSEGNVLFPAR
jgi:hypothetical protein